MDSQNNLISEIKLNEFGIGKTVFKPITGELYIINLKANEVNHQLKIDDIKPTGLALTLNEIQDKVILNFKTNNQGLNIFGNKTFNLSVHNGNELKIIPLQLDNQLEVSIALNFSSLFSGINIFTLFDENNNPILERLFLIT